MYLAQVQVVKTKPGVTAGAVRQGINTRFGIYTLAAWIQRHRHRIRTSRRTSYTPTTAMKSKSPKVASGPGIPGRRVVFIPIAKEAPGEGRDTVIVDQVRCFLPANLSRWWLRQ